MVGNSVKSFEGILYPSAADIHNNNSNSSSFLTDNPETGKIMIAMTLAIFAGSLQVCEPLNSIIFQYLNRSNSLF